MGSHWVGHDWSNLAAAATGQSWRPGVGGQPSRKGCSGINTSFVGFPHLAGYLDTASLNDSLAHCFQVSTKLRFPFSVAWERGVALGWGSRAPPTPLFWCRNRWTRWGHLQGVRETSRPILLLNTQVSGTCVSASSIPSFVFPFFHSIKIKMPQGNRTLNECMLMWSAIYSPASLLVSDYIYGHWYGRAQKVSSKKCQGQHLLLPLFLGLALTLIHTATYLPLCILHYLTSTFTPASSCNLPHNSVGWQGRSMNPLHMWRKRPGEAEGLVASRRSRRITHILPVGPVPFPAQPRS